jgi:hypothetical protein
VRHATASAPDFAPARFQVASGSGPLADGRVLTGIRHGRPR